MRERGLAMAAAAKERPGSMAAILGVPLGVGLAARFGGGAGAARLVLSSR